MLGLLSRVNQNNFERAKLMKKRGKYEKAIKHYFSALNERNVKKEDVYFEIGVCYFLDKNYENSIKYFNKSLKLNKDDKVAANIGITYGILENYSKSLIYFNLAWSIKNKKIYKLKIDKLISYIGKNCLENIR